MKVEDNDKYFYTESKTNYLEAKKNENFDSITNLNHKNNSTSMVQEINLEILNKEDLMELIEKKQSDEYRNIKFTLSNMNDNKTAQKNYFYRTSFDFYTFVDQEEDGDNYNFKWSNNNFNTHLRDTRRGKFRIRSQSPTKMSSFGIPHNSINTHFYSNKKKNYFESFDLLNLHLSRYLNTNKRTFPTKPVAKHKGISVTMLHKNYKNLYLNKLYNEENKWFKPLIPLRVILVYINGRKHTWVALDWVLKCFVENGDTLVIFCTIDHKLLTSLKNTYFAFGQNSFIFNGDDIKRKELKQNSIFSSIAQEIMDYIMKIIDPNIILKISVEILLGKTKDVFKGMFNLYEPSLICIGTKTNIKELSPLKSWLSSKLTDRLVKNFPLPVIIVPAINMCTFERNLENEINNYLTENDLKNINDDLYSKYSKNSEENTSYISSSKSTNSNSNYDVNSSIGSKSYELLISSDESYSSYNEISRLYIDYKKSLFNEISKLSLKQIDDEYFANLVKVISDKSISLCHELKSVDPDIKGKGAKLVSILTGSNLFGIRPYKSKSLILSDHESKAISSNTNNALSYKELKKNLKLNALKNQINSLNLHEKTLKNSVTYDNKKNENFDSKGVSLKFVNLESPKSNKKNKKMKNSQKLNKSLSHEIDNLLKIPVLESSSSFPNFKPFLNQKNIISSNVELDKNFDNKKKTKKKKKFWKILSLLDS